MLSKEELLKSRWKVIADYPGSYYKIGEIVEVTPDNREWSPWTQVLTRHVSHDDTEYDPEHFPAIFKRLQWWEDRKPEELPEKLLWKNKNLIFKPQQSTYSCFVWFQEEILVPLWQTEPIDSNEEYPPIH